MDTKITTVKADPKELSHVIKVKTHNNTDPFYIPVVDVRDGEEQRILANQILKESNKSRGSAYMKPSFTGIFGESYNERGTNKYFPKRKVVK